MPSAKWRPFCLTLNVLTHWGRVTHICVSKLTIIGSDNGLSPGRHQAIIWTNAGILLIGQLGTNFNEILIEIHIISFKKIHLKMSSGKWRPCCLTHNVLTSTEFRAWISNHIHLRLWDVITHPCPEIRPAGNHRTYQQTSHISSTLVGSNYIFIIDLTPGFNRLGKDNCKTRRETSKFWDDIFDKNVIFCYETGPIQWIFNQHYGYKWPGALARGQK